MMPPICSLCGREDFDHAELVYFAKVPQGPEWDRRTEQEGFTGHPAYAGWFCPTHLEAAKALSHLTSAEGAGALAQAVCPDYLT